MRIRGAQKNTDPKDPVQNADPDPQHCQKLKKCKFESVILQTSTYPILHLEDLKNVANST